MKEQRCPECGNRLTTNYCEICLRKVPFAGFRTKTEQDPWDASSTHWEESDHKCITFEETPSKAPKQILKKTKTKKTGELKKPAIIAILLAALSISSSIFGLVSDLTDDAPPVEHNAEEIVAESDLPVLQPMELYNDGEILVRVDSLVLAYEEPAVSVTIENASEKDIDVVIEKVAINSYMVDSALMEQVNAGDTCQTVLCLFEYELENANIEQIARIDLRLRIYDRDSYDQIFYADRIAVFTDAADNYTQVFDGSGLELYNDGSTFIWLKDMSVSDYGDGEIKVFIQNTSGSDVTINTNGIYLNGQEAEGYMGASLMSDTCAVTGVYLMDLESLDIKELDQIKEITVGLQIDYMDNWEILESYSERITFEPADIQ